MKNRKPVTAIAILTCVLTSVAGCGPKDAEAVDKTPLPGVAAPPYICEHVPLLAVERMTGLHNPLTQGNFKVANPNGYGSCSVYEPTGERWKVMSVRLLSQVPVGNVEEEIRLGAERLPRIVPDGDGFYFPIQYEEGDDNAGYAGAKATLVRGDTALIIEIIRAPKERDQEADAVALMKLIGPKLIVAADPPSPSPA